MTGRAVRGRALLAAALVLATLAVFLPVLGNEFVGYDDDLYITANPQVRAGLSPRGLRWAFTTTHTGYAHPLTWLSHMLDVELFGLRAGGHHLMSVVLHAAVAVLLLLLLIPATGAPGRSAAVALLFAIHPLHVESVAWASERKDVLSAFFAMAALLAYLGYARSPGWRRYALVLGFYALGLLSKPMLVTLPGLMLLLDYWPLGRGLPGKSPPAGFRSRLGPLLLEKLPPLVLAGAWSACTWAAQKKAGIMGDTQVFPLAVRLDNALVSLVKYLWKTAWPTGLAFFYPHPGTRLSPAQTVPAALLLAAVTVLALRWRGRRPWLIVGWGWYLVTLLPVIGLVQVGLQAMADRYTYLPLTGVFIAVAWGSRDLIPAGRAGAALPAAVAVAAVALSLVTRGQIAYWKDSESLFTRGIAVTRGNFVAWNNLGNLRLSQGRPAEARAAYLEALRLRPGSTEALYNLGVLEATGGRREEAASLFREALRSDPGNADAHFNLGLMLEQLGDAGSAEGQYRRALNIRPDDADAWSNLGLLLLKRGETRQAGEFFLKALGLNPALPEALVGLGDILAGEGRVREAEERYRKALAARPGYEPALRRLGLEGGAPAGGG